ncbi:MAG: calcium-binding protein, partial [Acidobacteria bacterium]
ESLDPSYGGDDTITSGGGADLVIGGPGNDKILTCGNPVFGQVDGDIVAGDNARATYMLGELREFYTTSPQFGGEDTILTGNGADLVLGGSGDDRIDTGVYGVYDHGAIQVISFNFHSDAPSGMVTGVAGAVPAGHWNNLLGGWKTYGAAAGEPVLFGDGQTAAGVTIQWGMNIDSPVSVTASPVCHGGIVNPGTQNEQLFRGYLRSDYWDTLGVNLTGLGAFQGPYDLYVYLDDSASTGAAPQISDGTTTFYLSDPAGHTFQGQFVEVTSTTPGQAQVGNYVVFRGLTAASVRLRITSAASDSFIYPVISALQIVGGPDRDTVVRGGDCERDTVAGDHGAGYFCGGRLWELRSLDPTVGGADTIQTGEDTDLVLGGPGDDRIDGQEGHDVLLGDNGRFTLFNGVVIGLDFDQFTEDWDGSVRPFALAGIGLTDDPVGGADMLAGGPGDDLLYGQFGDDTYVFAGQGLGRDVLVEAGDNDPAGRANDLRDRLDFSRFEGPVQVALHYEDPQLVNDQIVHSEINLVLILLDGTAFEDASGSRFADRINGNARANSIEGGPGDDLLRGDYGDDRIDAGAGDDRIEGGPGADELRGGPGNDQISGAAGADGLWGDAGDDTLDGGPGADDLQGGAGNDVLAGAEDA